MTAAEERHDRGDKRDEPGERPRDDTAEKDREDEDTGLDGLGQAGTSEPQPGVAENQGGGIEDAIGGGQSGQGGG